MRRGVRHGATRTAPVRQATCSDTRRSQPRQGAVGWHPSAGHLLQRSAGGGLRCQRLPCQAKDPGDEASMLASTPDTAALQPAWEQACTGEAVQCSALLQAPCSE